MSPESAFDTPVFETRLTPHRSLDQRGFWLLMGFFSLVSFAVSLAFFWIGAWPVAGFFGLDVALLYLALKLSFRSARAYEQVRLTPVELQIARVNSGGRRAEWRFNPAWVRLESEEIEDYGMTHLAIASRGRRLEIARALGPDARAAFARELTLALGEARRGPRFS